MAERKARLAFVGLGTMGKDLLKEAAKNPRAEIAALCDIEPEALKQAAEIAGAQALPYADYHEMLRAGIFDGVVVAVPQYLHAELSVASLDAGYTTFSEKPMGMDVGQCAAMIEAARRSGRPLMIGQVLRYIGVYRYVLERVALGDLGKPFVVRMIRSGGKWGSWARPWRYKRATTGGLLLEVNVHEIDFMRCILGEANSVSALGKRFTYEEIDFEDFITAQIEFANGGIGTLTTSSCDFLGRYTAEILCEKGAIYFDSVSQLVHVQKAGADKETIPYDQVHPEWENGVYREMREFAETCLGEHPATIPGEEGLRNVEIAEACYRSIGEGAPVRLPLSG